MTAANRPPTEAWNRLLEELRVAENELGAGVSKSRFEDAEMSAVLRSVIALDAYLMSSQVVVRDRLNAPLLKLFNALRDTVEGQKAALFQPPTTRRGANHPGKGISGQRLVGVAAKASDLLMAAGRSKAAAGAEVYKAILKAGDGLPIAHIDKVSAKTILNWRDQISAANLPTGRPSSKAKKQEVHPDAVAMFNRKLPAEAGDQPELQAKWLLHEISSGLILRL